jgi:hypothetical protein
MDPKGSIAFDIGFSERDIRQSAEAPPDLATDTTQESPAR